jgi:hypothetical protein
MTKTCAEELLETTNHTNKHEKGRGSRLAKSLMAKLLETTNHTNKHEKGSTKIKA